jgi:hypothetical protein
MLYIYKIRKNFISKINIKKKQKKIEETKILSNFKNNNN